MIDFLKKKFELFWKKVSLFGVRPDLSDELRRHVILSNQFSLTWIFLCITYISGFVFYDVFGAIVVSGIAITHILALWIVRKNYYNTARFLSSSIPIVFIFILAARVYNPHDSHCRIESFKILNIAFFILPFMVFTAKERVFLIVGAAISVLSYLFFEPINELFNRETTLPIYLSYSFEIFNYLVAIFLSGFTVYYLKQNDEKSRKRIQRLLIYSRQQNVRLEELYEKAHESNIMKRQFLANTTHELRTPLNAIYGFTNLLLKSKIDEKQRGQLQNIKDSSSNLIVIINDILDLSKIEAGKIVFEEVVIDIRKILKSIVENLSIRANEKQIDLSFFISEEVNPFIYADPTRLNQILNNLVSNAVKFTHEGGAIEILVSCNKVEDRVQWLKIEVKDNGIGISKEKQASIFESFNQADISTSRKYGGTGLGLSIVKGFVELMNGSIVLESKENIGSSFIITIPFNQGQEETKKDINNEEFITLYDCHPKNLRILLVEDNDINSMLAIDTISFWNSDIFVHRVVNGLECVKELEQNSYDLVLMDIQMPVMNGYEASRLIREKLKLEIPIIALNANTSDEEKSRCLEAGMDQHLSKPFEPNDLFKLIQAYTCIESKKEFGDRKKINPQNFICLRHKNDLQSGKISPILENVNFENDNQFAYTTKFIDMSTFTRMYKGKHDKMKRPLKMLLEDVTNELGKLINCLNNNDIENVSVFAHSLKSKFRLIGLNIPATYLNQMELSAKNNVLLPGTKLMLDEILLIWKEASKEIQDIIK